MALSEGTRFPTVHSAGLVVAHEDYADHVDVLATFTRVPNELKLMFAEKLEIRDVCALARTCRGMNALLTRSMYRRAKDLKGMWGRPYFLRAVDGGSLAAVQRFVEVGAEVNATDRGTLLETAVHSCAHYGHVEIAEFLIDEAGIDVSAADRVGCGVLYSSVTGKHPKPSMITLLARSGADVKAPWYWRTPLHMAAMNGDVEVVQCLLNLGADPNAADWDGPRPVHLAAALSNAAKVRCLLEGRQDVEIAGQCGRTPLHYAVERGMTECATVLLRMGADVSSVDRAGNTPLLCALCSRGNTASIHRILHLGATMVDRLRGTEKCAAETDMPDCVPSCRVKQPNLIIIEMLLAAGSDIAKRNIYGSSPLSWAADRHTKPVFLPVGRW